MIAARNARASLSPRLSQEGRSPARLRHEALLDTRSPRRLGDQNNILNRLAGKIHRHRGGRLEVDLGRWRQNFPGWPHIQTHGVARRTEDMPSGVGTNGWDEKHIVVIGIGACLPPFKRQRQRAPSLVGRHEKDHISPGRGFHESVLPAVPDFVDPVVVRPGAGLRPSRETLPCLPGAAERCPRESEEPPPIHDGGPPGYGSLLRPTVAHSRPDGDQANARAGRARRCCDGDLPFRPQCSRAARVGTQSLAILESGRAETKSVPYLLPRFHHELLATLVPADAVVLIEPISPETTTKRPVGSTLAARSRGHWREPGKFRVSWRGRQASAPS